MTYYLSHINLDSTGKLLENKEVYCRCLLTTIKYLHQQYKLNGPFIVSFLFLLKLTAKCSTRKNLRPEKMYTRVSIIYNKPCALKLLCADE